METEKQRKAAGGNMGPVLQEALAAAKEGKALSPYRVMEALSSGPGLAAGLERMQSDKDNAAGTSELLRRSASVLWNPETILGRLMKETNAKGIRNSDLSQLTGWPASKVSKVTSGKQKLTEEDVKTWAMVLGYTADAFIQMEYDLRDYRLSEHVRPVRDCFQAFFGVDRERDEDIIQFELPLSILSAIGVKVSDYLIDAGEYRDIFMDSSYVGMKSSRYVIAFIQKNLHDAENDYPMFGYWVEPKQNSMVLSVAIGGAAACVDDVDKEESKKDKRSAALLRQRMKALLGITDLQTDEFDEFIQTWDGIPDDLAHLEIASVTYSLCNLPDEEEMMNDLHRIFKVFCDLAWEMAGTDLAPPGYRDTGKETLSPYDMFNILSGTGSFSHETIRAVREKQAYECEMDSSHPSFMDDTGNPYMDVVPLVPFRQGTEFGNNIFQKENGLCLCPLCSSRLLHGTREDKEDMIFKLFRKHSKGLRKAGIEISLGQLMSVYGL